MAPKGLEQSVSTVGAALVQFRAALRLLCADPRLCVPLAAVFLPVAITLVVAAVALPSPATPPARVVSGEEPWRYLVICGHCGQRSRMLEHPVQTWEQQDGFLRCPKCEAFAVGWYRRGSSTLPPGGWDAPDYAPETQAAP